MGASCCGAPRYALTDRQAGFTLIELLVVLAVLGLAMAAAMPLFSRALPAQQERAAAAALAVVLRELRDAAIAGHQVTTLELDAEARGYVAAGLPRAGDLPDWIGLELVIGDVPAPQVGLIHFFPDGSSTGGRIVLRGRTGGYQIDIDWLTGRVRLGAL